MNQWSPRRVNFNNRCKRQAIACPCAACNTCNTTNETVRCIGHRAILDDHGQSNALQTQATYRQGPYTMLRIFSSLLLSHPIRLTPIFSRNIFFLLFFFLSFFFFSFFKVHLSFPRPRFEYLFLIYPVYERPSFLFARNIFVFSLSLSCFFLGGEGLLSGLVKRNFYASGRSGHQSDPPVLETTLAWNSNCF